MSITAIATVTATAFTTIDSLDLDTVSGGVGVGVDAKLDVKADLSQTTRDVGNGLSKVVGCATGASSMREFGNCMLTGQLGNVPAAPAAAPAGR